MTQLILEIESPDLVKKVKEALSHIFGVRIISSSNEIKYADKDTEAFLKRFAGSWKEYGSVEEIMGRINEFKTSRPPISF